MKLLVAEKPSVARDLARVLGVATRGKTHFEGNDWVITWCIGHLVELEEPHAYDARWKSWRLDTLPMLPAPFLLRSARHAADQLAAVSKLLKDRRFGGVVNACDAGREGELIFRYVYQFAKSRLRVERLWISSLTDEAIKRGFAGLRPGKDFNALADAARSRSEADWLVGMNATRAVTVRGRQTGHDALFSIGRVQTPTLAMLVQRERTIREFQPQRYWEVRGELQTAAGAKLTAHWRWGKQSRLGSEPLATAVVTRATAVATGAVVEQVIAKTQKEPPPLLFDLTTLQRTANRRFGFSAQRTLELAQALYESHKLLTYPRTDSRHLTSDQVPELPPLFASLKAVPEYLPFIADLRTRQPAWRTPGKRIVDDSKVHDHHAIIPTGSPIQLDRLNSDERKLFDLVARRFLGAFFPDAEIAATEVWIRVGAATPRPRFDDKVPADLVIDALPPPPDRFVARGRVRMVAGWQAVAGIDERAAVRDRTEQRSKDVGAPADATARDDAAAGPLPILVEGDVLTGAYLTRAKQTTPPARFTEATLLGAMETAGKSIDDEALRAAMAECGLGTPATRANIIETLLRRDYIAREKRDLVPTPTGIQLITALPVASLASPELTGSWEARLSRIARGQDTRAAFMADIARYIEDMISTIRR